MLADTLHLDAQLSRLVGAMVFTVLIGGVYDLVGEYVRRAADRLAR